MAAISEGKVCIRKFGKGSGEEVTITKVLDDHFVMVKDKKGKEKRANIKHLEPVAH